MEALRKLTTIRSYTGHARYLAGLDHAGRIIGYVPRKVRTPYASGPTHAVYSVNGVPIIIAETSHKVYQVFEVSPSDVQKTEAAIIAEMTRSAPPLPGAEAVRDTEITTPEFTVEFALTPVVGAGCKPRQRGLFEED